MEKQNSSYQGKTVTSVEQFIEFVKEDTKDWVLIPGCTPWFRGQKSCDWPPLPGIFRKKIKETEIISKFHKLAPMFGNTPSRGDRDEWLYFMQHVGVPTRLLDWSEGALIGLYFAVYDTIKDTDPGVWVIHPLELNKETISNQDSFPDANDDVFQERCNLAWGAEVNQSVNIECPIAIIPTYSHPRMKSQKGCFTFHGSEDKNFEKLAEDRGLREKGFFHKYIIDYSKAKEILRDLRLLGITHSALFPDHDGLATDLKCVFDNEMKI